MGKQRDQAIRDIVKGAGIVYAGLVIEVVIAFLAQVIAARFLSASSFGGITTGTALVNIGAIIAGLGFGPGLTRYLPRLDAGEKAAVTRFAYLLTVPFSVVLGALVSLNATFIASRVFDDPAVAESIRVFGAAIPFAAVLALAIGGIRGQQIARYRIYIKNILHPVLRFALVGVAVLYGLGEVGVAFAYAIPYVVGAVLATALLFRSLSAWDRERTPGSDLREEFLSYSLPFTVAGMAGFLYRSIDIFLLLYLIDSSAVGIYAVAYAAARLILMFSTAFNFLGSPVASELEADGDITDALSVNSTILRWLVMASIPALVPLVFFPAEFISIIYRPSYAEGASALVILAIAFAIHNVFSAQRNLLEAVGNSRIIAVNNVLAGALNVGLNLLLIPRLGIDGAALATAAAYLLQDALMIGELRYELGQWAFDRSVLPPVLVAVPSLVVFTPIAAEIPGTFLWIVAAGALFTLVYTVLYLVIVGFTDEEVMVIESARQEYGVDPPGLERVLQWFS
jgi:O-antigen/teichoic acid export membrane protein